MLKNETNLNLFSNKEKTKKMYNKYNIIYQAIGNSNININIQPENQKFDLDKFMEKISDNY